MEWEVIVVAVDTVAPADTVIVAIAIAAVVVTVTFTVVVAIDAAVVVVVSVVGCLCLASPIRPSPLAKQPLQFDTPLAEGSSVKDTDQLRITGVASQEQQTLRGAPNTLQTATLPARSSSAPKQHRGAWSAFPDVRCVHIAVWQWIRRRTRQVALNFSDVRLTSISCTSEQSKESESPSHKSNSPQNGCSLLSRNDPAACCPQGTGAHGPSPRRVPRRVPGRLRPEPSPGLQRISRARADTTEEA